MRPAKQLIFNDRAYDVLQWTNFFQQINIPSQAANEYAVDFYQHQIRNEHIPFLTSDDLENLRIHQSPHRLAILAAGNQISIPVDIWNPFLQTGSFVKTRCKGPSPKQDWLKVLTGVKIPFEAADVYASQLVMKGASIRDIVEIKDNNVGEEFGVLGHQLGLRCLVGALNDCGKPHLSNTRVGFYNNYNSFVQKYSESTKYLKVLEHGDRVSRKMERYLQEKKKRLKKVNYQTEKKSSKDFKKMDVKDLDDPFGWMN